MIADFLLAALDLGSVLNVLTLLAAFFVSFLVKRMELRRALS